MAPAGGQLHFFGDGAHVRSAHSKARQDADFDGHPPATGLDQGGLVEIVSKTFHGVCVVLHH